MKILFIVKYYDNYRNQFYKKLNSFDTLSYEAIVNSYLNDYFSFYSSLVQILNDQGHESKLLIPNCNVLREKWSTENNIKCDGAEEFIFNYANEFKPEIIFLNSNFEYYGDTLNKLKKVTTNLFCWISCPFDKHLDLSSFKTVFTLFPPHHDFFKSNKIKSRLLNAGFDERVLKNINHTNSEKIDFSFIGGIGGFHKKREDFLKTIVKESPLKMWGYGFNSDNSIKQLIKRFKYGSEFLNRYQGQAWGMEMFQLLFDSKITLNIHGDIAVNYSVNMRLYEATGMGTLLLTDESENLSKLFIPNIEIVTFKTPAEAIEKYNYYISHEEERNKIAAAGQKRTLENYNYTSIAEIFIEEFNKAYQS